jgi:broad specificity phosphatase PhoE
MKNGRLALALLIAFLAPALPALAQKTVIVVRHGEKFSDTDERLTEAGQARAQLLAKMLKDSGITAIFSTDTDRTRGTVQPVATAFKQQVRIYDNPAALIATLRRDHANDVVLVAGHSNSVPVILKMLGCADDITIEAQEYDNLFVVVPKADRTATLVRLRY